MGLGNATLSDEQIKGTLRIGQVVQAKHPDRKELVEATISKIQDCSQYTVGKRNCIFILAYFFYHTCKHFKVFIYMISNASYDCNLVMIFIKILSHLILKYNLISFI